VIVEEVKKKEMHIKLPGKDVTIQVVENIEALITDLSDEDKVPCWADIWPASLGMAKFIWEHLLLTEDDNVIELGAGMGLPGIVCGLKGARVTLSDFNPLALEIAGENARLNSLQAGLLLEDWRTFSSGEKYDWLLASDVMYDPKLNPYLGEIFSNNIAPGGRILVSHPWRKATYEFLQSWREKKYYNEEVFVQEVEMEDTLLPRYRIFIHLLRALS